VRTLYVAMTRAKDRLVLAGAWPQRESAPEPAQARTHVDLSSPAPIFRSSPISGPHPRRPAAGRPPTPPAPFGTCLTCTEREATPEGEREIPELPAPEEVQRAPRSSSPGGARRRPAWPSRGAPPPPSEAHERLRELQADSRFEDRAPGEEPAANPEPAAPREPPDREAAMAAGGPSTGRWRAGTWKPIPSRARPPARAPPSYLAALLGDARPDRAQRRAAALLDRFAAGPLLPRLCSLAAGVLARELPVLLPRPRETAPVGYVAGAIDLFL